MTPEKRMQRLAEHYDYGANPTVEEQSDGTWLVTSANGMKRGRLTEVRPGVVENELYASAEAPVVAEASAALTLPEDPGTTEGAALLAELTARTGDSGAAMQRRALALLAEKIASGEITLDD